MITDIERIIRELNQHEAMNIRVATNTSHLVTPEIAERFSAPHRKTRYFFLFITQGHITHSIDLEEVTASAGEILFVLPGQIHTVPPSRGEVTWFKVTFDEACLSMLPQKHPFLINPLGLRLIKPDEHAQVRIQALYQFLLELLRDPRADTTLVLTYLNTLLTEFNRSYFTEKVSLQKNTSKFIAFRMLVEDQLTNHPDIEDIARQLSVTADNLYNIVKKQTGQSPKAYITGRLMLEAQRRLYYDEITVKELAYDLGFNDPDYFSRLFKKTTGRSISDFLKALPDLSGK